MASCRVINSVVFGILLFGPFPFFLTNFSIAGQILMARYAGIPSSSHLVEQNLSGSISVPDIAL